MYNLALQLYITILVALDFQTFDSYMSRANQNDMLSVKVLTVQFELFPTVLLAVLLNINYESNYSMQRFH